MTDFSKIKNIDELEYQIDRMQRRANIQKEHVDRHVNLIETNIKNFVSFINSIVKPIRVGLNKYINISRTIWEIIRKIFFKK